MTNIGIRQPFTASNGFNTSSNKTPPPSTVEIIDVVYHSTSDILFHYLCHYAPERPAKLSPQVASQYHILDKRISRTPIGTAGVHLSAHSCSTIPIANVKFHQGIYSFSDLVRNLQLQYVSQAGAHKYHRVFVTEICEVSLLWRILSHSGLYLPGAAVADMPLVAQPQDLSSLPKRGGSEGRKRCFFGAQVAHRGVEYVEVA